MEMEAVQLYNVRVIPDITKLLVDVGREMRVQNMLRKQIP
jgi:hypothetical protein